MNFSTLGFNLTVVWFCSILFTMVSQNSLVLVFTVGCFITHISFSKFRLADSLFSKSHPSCYHCI